MNKSNPIHKTAINKSTTGSKLDNKIMFNACVCILYIYIYIYIHALKHYLI